MSWLARRVIYEGRVQGVGFRWATLDLAKGFEIGGTVRNLDDGRVELCVSGESEEVEAYLQAIRESGLAGNIGGEFPEPLPEAPRFRGFKIL